jgi:glycosyltransferase involved in cell wall biosynthesis
VHTDSENSRHDNPKRGRYPVDRITAIHQAAAAHFAPIADCAELEKTRVKYQLAGRIVLADGIKNPSALIDAHAQLPEALQADTQLVFFSREATPRPPVAAVLGRPHVRFIPQPTSDELVRLMNLATVFAFPSWYEGFGLPLVEAMQCGTPIIASSRGSIPEIVGDAGLIFHLEAPEQVSGCLRTILEDETLRLSIAKRARARSREFTWERTARRTLAVYDSVVHGSRHTP